MTQSSDENRRARLINAMLERVDVNDLLDRVDVNRLLDRIDLDRLLERVDVDALMARVDVNALTHRVDVDALVSRVDVEALTKKAKVGELVARGTTQVAGSTLDVARRQAVGLDTLIMRFVNQLLRRPPGSKPLGPPELVPGTQEIES